MSNGAKPASMPTSFGASKRRIFTLAPMTVRHGVLAIRSSIAQMRWKYGATTGPGVSSGIRLTSARRSSSSRSTSRNH